MKATKRLVLYLPPIFLLSPLKETAAQTKQYGGRHMGFGMIFWVAFWVLVIVGLVFLIRWLIQATKGGRGVSHGSSRALDILIDMRLSEPIMWIEMFQEIADQRQYRRLLTKTV